MKYSGIEGECPALALGLCHTSPHPQFSLSYCGHISKKTHQPQDIRLKMKVGNGSAMSGCKTLWCDFALVGNYCTPAITHSISGLKSWVFKLPFLT